jgi:DNA primase
VEPGYLKAERALIKLMLIDEFYDQLKNVINLGDFIIESHNKIYSLILQGKKVDNINIISYVESRCDDIESSKEWTNIKEHEMLAFADKDRLIMDYIKEIKSFKLKLQIEDLRKKQNRFEKEGEIEESIRIAIELTKLSEMLKKRERG